MVQAEGLEAEFECLYSNKNDVLYFWVINGIRSTESSAFPSEFTVFGGARGTTTMITIPALPQYNNTIVQCGVFLVSGDGGRELSRNSTLVVGTYIGSQAFGPLNYFSLVPTFIQASYWEHYFSKLKHTHIACTVIFKLFLHSSYMKNTKISTLQK